MKNGRFERSASLPEDGVDLISACIPKKNRIRSEPLNALFVERNCSENNVLLVVWKNRAINRIPIAIPVIVRWQPYSSLASTVIG